MDTRQRRNQHLETPGAALPNRTAGACVSTVPITTLAYQVNKCAKSDRERVPLCVSLGDGIPAGEASTTGGVEQHVHAAMSIRIKAHMEPTSSTAYGVGDLQSSTAYPSLGDSRNPARMVSQCFSQVPASTPTLRSLDRAHRRGLLHQSFGLLGDNETWMDFHRVR